MARLGLVRLLVLLALAGPLLLPAAARAAPDLPAICERVAEMASAQTGVPVSVLKAISLTETGRRHNGAFRPWPWTVNMEGKGVWFDTEDDARAYVYKEYKRGARSFDVGCFQINFKWHGHEFSSIDEMFDPLKNALYAGRFLRDLYAETGSWTKAAGAYHSRTPKHANRYAARFEQLRNRFVAEDGAPRTPRLPTDPVMRARQDAIPTIPDIVLAQAEAQRSRNAPRAAPPPEPRVNTFPLLRTGGNRSTGSLVPLGRAARPLAGYSQTAVE
ncbi:transglycosylase SLT domain-containing protein [Phaeovulum vinaykumarii]|uniref:Transglycosylase SLT domain-containing protein n=1 Tax=Phaeovulum vinaykumarii TaxID=407234 RepID=A0A1N7KUX4_9RHOB|nr:transglycosylase SLT domain-containing protein [Phaeovulum vinaykumarii]SIS65395.1 Transglycosylase SLT domain-containing protein [Phaeovulum vinaykumarii]SOC01290.1 transglycosylase-like protein with SLT domain [Phaeovulum vinaykumarii]